MVHERQCLALGLEAGDHLAGVHSGLDDLERDPAADGRLLLGHVDDAHSPFADFLQQLVGTDAGSRAFEDRADWGRTVARCDRRIGLTDVRRARGVDLNALAEPARPAQSVDGVCGYFQATASAALDFCHRGASRNFVTKRRRLARKGQGMPFPRYAVNAFWATLPCSSRYRE